MAWFQFLNVYLVISGQEDGSELVGFMVLSGIKV